MPSTDLFKMPLAKNLQQHRVVAHKQSKLPVTVTSTRKKVTESSKQLA